MNTVRSFALAFLVLALPFGGYAQHTVGLLSYKPWAAFDGYNLLYPHNQPNVYLLDNCGRIVHVWTDMPQFRPGNTAYLLEDGRLVKAKRPANVANDPIWAGGGGATVEIRDWDNNLLWSFTLNDSTARLHHDFAITDEGTLLLLAWERKSADEAIAAGRDPATLTEGELWPEMILEVDPATDEIVWEWHVWDHLVQDFDPSKPNFGEVAALPQRIDLNFDPTGGDADWMHANAIDYRADIDQILLSVPTFNEVWVIDHSTTPEEAAGHSGGLGGLGGDLLYRWGNPQTYRAGDSTDQKLFFQHDAQWVDDFLDFTHPHYQKIAVFNNRVAPDFSTVNVFTPPWDMYSWSYTLIGGMAWGPTDFDLTLTHPDTFALHSTGLSGVQFLPNGNVLITSGRWGYTFELSPDGEVVWEYKTPLRGGAPVAQGDTLELNQNLTFRVRRYPTDYPA
ncbi:MAG: hypothetical protein D6765_00165, partial [Bacteroidetes bacterium]